MSAKDVKRPKRCKRSWGRRILIDRWGRLVELIELIQGSLPIDKRIDLTQHPASTLSRWCPPEEEPAVGRALQPLAFESSGDGSDEILTLGPFLVEVRVLLFIDERLGWLLPVHFCIGQLLTADEVITKIRDAFWILETWTYTHTHEYRRFARTRKPVKKTVIQ